jgi:hypothetical protein
MCEIDRWRLGCENTLIRHIPREHPQVTSWMRKQRSEGQVLNRRVPNSNFTYKHLHCSLTQGQSINSCIHLNLHINTISLDRCVKTSPRMRLRTRIQPPERFEDEDHNISAANNATKPAFPRLLREQTISFDPHLPPAAFPSLTQAHPQEDGDPILDNLAEPADVDMMDIDRHVDHTFLPMVRRREHLAMQTASAISPNEKQDPPLFGRSFLDDAETSDEEEIEVSLHQSTIPVKPNDSNQRPFLQIQQAHAERLVANSTKTIHWTQLAPCLQVEIFENLCDSRYGHVTHDILGLSRNELYDVMKHLWTRNKQIVAEDQGIQQLQQAQLRAILRKDHSSSLNTDNWRDHVAYTRRHLPYISARLDYFICNEAEVELAMIFLNERGIDSRVLGEWGRSKTDKGFANWTQSQAVKASERSESVDSGYTSQVAQQEARHVTNPVGHVLTRNALSEISNSACRAVSAPSSLRRKRPQSMLDTRQDTVIRLDRGFGLSTAVAMSPAPAGLQIPGSTMSLRARGSHLTQKYEEGMALMRGGGLEDSDVSHEGEHDRLKIQSLPRLKINPPKPARDKEASDAGNVSTSPGQRATMLKISPKRLEKVQMTSSSGTRPSTIGPYEVLTPPTMTSTRKPINDTGRYNRSRPHQPMPVAREALTWQNQDKLTSFSLKLLEIQRGAGGLETPPNFPPSQQSDLETLTSPKRLRLNPPQDSSFNQSSDDTQLQTPSGSSQLQRKDSASSHDAPPWSPITQRSDSFSGPSSRKESYNDGFRSYKLPSTDRPAHALQPGPNVEIESIISTAPKTPQHAKTSYVKPSIAENGSPVLTLASDIQKLPAHFLGERTQQEAKLKVVQDKASPQLLEPVQSPRRNPSYPGTPSRGSTYGAPTSTDPLRIYGSNLFRASPNGSQYSPSRQLTETLAGAVLRTSTSAKKAYDPPPSISPAEQSKVEALLSSFKKRPHTAGEKLESRVPGPVSTTSSPSLKKQSLTEEDELPTGSQASSAKKANEAVVAATVALKESPRAKTGTDGKVRPRTYIKSEKQIQKEAANAAAKAGFGKSRAIGKTRTTEGQKTDAKAGLPSHTTKHESPASQTAAHIEATLTGGEHIEENGPFVEKQGVVDPNNNNSVEDLETVEERAIEQPEIVTPSKRKPFGSSDLKLAQKVKKVATDDESYEEDETSDVSMAIKKIATPKGKKLAVDRAKVAVQGYQTGMAMRGKSASTDAMSKKKNSPRAKTADGKGEPVVRREASSKLGSAAIQRHEGALPEDRRIAKTEEVQSPGAPPSSRKAILKTKVSSGDGEQSTPTKRKKKASGLTRELSVLTAQGEGRTKAFRGNQYLNADGTPRPRKEAATPGA